MKKIIIILGTPLSGKKTHAKLLSEKLKYELFNLEEVILKEINNKTKIGLIVEKHLKNNSTIPDEYLIMLMKESVINLKENGLIFQGFPLTVNQAKALDSFLFLKKIKKAIPVFLKINAFETEARLVKKNNEKTLKNIMDFYENNNKKVVDYYLKDSVILDTFSKEINDISENIIKNIF